jgi:hypothetical protein
MLLDKSGVVEEPVILPPVELYGGEVTANHQGGENNMNGLCGCGCGQRTPIATKNIAKAGAVKGQPRRFVPGHSSNTGKARNKVPQSSLNLSGLCGCGCGGKTPIARQTRPERGQIQGLPLRFINGHNAQKSANPVHHLPNGTSIIEIIRKGEKMECVIDTADYDLVKAFRWRALKHNKTFYAGTMWKQPDGHPTTKLMHILLMPGGFERDHENRNGLDNRRDNLRFCTHAQNQTNKSKQSGCSSIYKGVGWNKVAKHFQARIRVSGKLLSLGCYTNEKDAAKAYDRAVLERHGEFAVLNFPSTERVA